MQCAVAELVDLTKLRAFEVGSFRVGRIVEITEKGEALVDYPGNPFGSIAARSLIATSLQQDGDGEKSLSFSVLLVFENGDPALPIIVGILHDTLYPPALTKTKTFSMERHDIIADGRKMVFDAKEEIVLRCGKSSIMLKKDGKVIVKGSQIVSRSSGINKIKGASVRIN